MIVGFFKAQPTEYAIQFVNGKVRKQGLGVSFTYLRLKTEIVLVPTNSIDSHFVFNELTNNFQEVTLQGQFTYVIKEPLVATKSLNLTIDPRSRRPKSNDLETLPQRISNVIQLATREELRNMSLVDAISKSDTLSATVFSKISASPVLGEYGVQLQGIHFLSLKPIPEVAKALEATYRESLLRDADKAIYERREAAVQQEQRINERQLEANISLERQREQLIELSGANQLKEAESRGKALEEEMTYKLRTLKAELETYQGIPPASLLAVAMKGIGDNADKIGNLTITSEVLSSILEAKK
ncbi:MAG: SPFH domain-containing protein [Armatimonadota bacterium]